MIKAQNINRKREYRQWRETQKSKLIKGIKEKKVHEWRLKWNYKIPRTTNESDEKTGLETMFL